MVKKAERNVRIEVKELKQLEGQYSRNNFKWNDQK